METSVVSAKGDDTRSSTIDEHQILQSMVVHVRTDRDGEYGLCRTDEGLERKMVRGPIQAITCQETVVQTVCDVYARTWPVLTCL